MKVIPTAYKTQTTTNKPQQTNHNKQTTTNKPQQTNLIIYPK
jgi:hypothetical protein